MFIIIGLLVVFGSIIGGYVLHQGEMGVLIQTSEFIIIGGAAVGAVIVGNPPRLAKLCVTETLALLKPSPYGKAAFGELMQVLYDVFQTARREGMIVLEAHIESPETSDILKRYPGFLANHHAVSLLADTLKVLLTGTVEDHHLSEILEMDLERHHEEAMAVPHALNKVADALPGFGIVAAVLGVIITMGSINGAAAEIGEKVAAALVGTFLGILLSYGVVGPIAQAIEGRVKAEATYLSCIRTALLSFARGDSPMTSVEFARRNIEPVERPSFVELEGLTRKRAAA